MSRSKVKILIVDDSLVIQKLLSFYIAKQPDFEIVGICSDPFQASKFISEIEIDCMILDLELPKMDGVTFLKKLKDHFEVKTIVISSLLNSDLQLKNKLLNLGVENALPKPNGTNNDSFFSSLFESIRKIGNRNRIDTSFFNLKSDLLIIASSTGSTENVKRIITSYKGLPPTIIVVQHMNAEYTLKYAKALNLLTEFDVTEACDSIYLKEHSVYIAPGNFHLRIIDSELKYKFKTSQEAPVHGVRPAADVLLLNLPSELAKKTTVLILSGMGKDGAAGLAYLKKLGSNTLAESQESSLVFGMPKAAIDTGSVDQVLNIEQIINHLTKEASYELCK